MRQIAKKGDMALVLPSGGIYDAPQYSHYIGIIVPIFSDPHLLPNENVLVNECCEHGLFHPSFALIPIPPDSESKRLFADEPIERECIV